MAINDLFSQEVKVVNTGMTAFRDDLAHCGVSVIQVDWKPPVGVSPESLDIIDDNLAKIDEANAKALEIILKGKPVLTGMGVALDTIPGMKKNLILHSGPPITWERMSGPTRGAVIGALIYEGMAKTPEEAEALAASGKIEYAPCHEHDAVGPMAGIVSA
ncbi:MAG TPA: DUF1116 domain-containing protein, partial [Spirochaetota bacterium]|nr:DUF1116 domain-containing protein [Spirochaetota bacterium]